MAVAVFGQSLVQFYQAGFEALGRVSAYLRLVLAESAAEFGASLALVLAGAGVAGAAAGRAGAYMLGAAIGLPRWPARSAAGSPCCTAPRAATYGGSPSTARLCS